MTKKQYKEKKEREGKDKSREWGGKLLAPVDPEKRLDCCNFDVNG